MTNITEVAGDLDEIENIDLELLQKHILEDPEYIKLMEAIKQNKKPTQLPQDHPARNWSGSWEKMGLLSENGPITLNSEKILMPKGRQTAMIIEIHARTHGSVNRIHDTISKYCVWSKMKDDIRKVVDNCDICTQLLPSQSNGKPRRDKVSLNSLQPMEIIHLNCFSHNRQEFLAVRDHVSNFTFMFKLNQATSAQIITKLNTLQSYYG